MKVPSILLTLSILVFTAAFAFDLSSEAEDTKSGISPSAGLEMEGEESLDPEWSPADTIVERTIVATQILRGPSRYAAREAQLREITERWVRPNGPTRIALQAGHWRSHEAPDEQRGLRGNGTRGGGKQEWEVNLDIARRAAAILEEHGLEVEILPTTIPPGYWADVFVSIHADGNNNPSVSGFRAAAPRRDYTGRAQQLVEILERSYGEATGLRHYPNITRRMTGYYAFNARRYEHALHPMTTGVILETGFLTSPSDRRIIVDAPDRAARGIANAIVAFLEME